MASTSSWLDDHRVVNCSMQCMHISKNLQYMHTQELYRCTEDGCSHSYTLKNNLIHHLKTAHSKHEDKGRFICHLETCGKKFYHAKLLKQYLKEHNVSIGM